jgi:hypothetical protein
VTFKDLQRLVESQSQSRTVLNQLQRLRNRAFWYWDQNRHEEKDRPQKHRMHGVSQSEFLVGYLHTDPEIPIGSYHLTAVRNTDET